MDGITLSYMALDVFIVLLGINVGGEKDKGSMSDLKELLLNKFKKKDESDEAEKVIEVITKILKAIRLKMGFPFLACFTAVFFIFKDLLHKAVMRIIYRNSKK